MLIMALAVTAIGQASQAAADAPVPLSRNSAVQWERAADDVAAEEIPIERPVVAPRRREAAD